MTTIAGDRRHEYPESPAEGSESVQTPIQALAHLTRQYTPATDADHKAMFILTRFINGNECWSEAHYRAHKLRQRLAIHEARATERQRIKAFIDTARG